jgi:hypothetical protein
MNAPAPAPSCWPHQPGRCALGHPLSTQHFEIVKTQRVDTTTGELLHDPRTGKPLYDAVQVPQHLPVPPSLFDPSGMVLWPGCTHGLPVHPLTGAEAPEGTSYIRSRFLPVSCEEGHKLPDEALEPRALS